LILGAARLPERWKERESRERTQCWKEILEQLGTASWQELRERATEQPDSVFPLVFPVVAAAADARDGAAVRFCCKPRANWLLLVNAVANIRGRDEEEIKL